MSLEGLAGAVVGFFVGGPTGAKYGYAIGSALGSAFDSGPDFQGPRLKELNVQSSAYGAPIPIIYGKARVAGNIIWAKNIREKKIEEDSGGKGGGGSTSTTYEYYGTWAVALCDNEIAGVRKIWADAIKIYDVDVDEITASIAGIPNAFITILEVIQASNRNVDKITIHNGTEDQEPDSLIQADKGVANTQAYRGTAYLVFDDLLLEKYGNRIPNITCEVVTAGTSELRLIENQALPLSVGAGFTVSVPYWDHDNGAYYVFEGDWTSSYLSGNVYVYKRFSNGSRDLIKVFTVSAGGNSASNPRYTFSRDGIYQAYGGGSVFTRERFRIYELSGDASTSVTQYNFIISGGINFDNGLYHVYDKFLYALIKSPSGSSIQKVELFTGATGIYMGTWGPTMTVINNSSMDLKAYPIPHHLEIANDLIYILNTDNTIQVFDLDGILQNEISFSPSPSISYNTNGYEIAQIRVTGEKIYVFTNEVLFEMNLNGGGFNYIGSPSALVGYVPYGLGGLDVNDGVFYQYETNPSVSSDGGFAAFNWTSLSDNQVSLSSIVSDINTRAGLNLADIDTTNLTQAVEGYVVTRPMTGRGAIEPLQKAFFFDGSEVNNKLTYVNRGGAVVATIPEVDLGAGPYGQDVDLYTHNRQQDSELPSEVVVDYIDLNRSYEEGSQRARRINSPQENVIKISLPIVMTANYGKEIANVLLYNAHTERDKFSISVTNEYIDLNPTDVISFTVDGETRKARITKINYGDTIQLELLAEDSTVYSAESVAGESENSTQLPGLDGPTKLYLLDIPMLRNQDNDSGMYAAGSGYFSGWTGATIFKSLDSGTSYSPVNAILAASTMGQSTTILPSASHTTFDRASTVTVNLTSGTLSSSTEGLVIQGANFAILGSEIIQFVNATDNGDNTYTLDTLLRGRRGTDWAVGTHVFNEQFSLLRENILERVGAIVNTERYYKAASFGTYLEEAAPQVKTNAGISQKPFSVKYISGTRDGSNNLTITWTRRSRYIGSPLWNPPVFESSQLYSIEILSSPSGSVIATYSSTSPSYLYTAASQSGNGLTPGNPVHVKIYQVSSVVGNGYGTEATV